MLGARVRVPDVAVGTVSLHHKSVDGNGLHDLTVLGCLHGAAIDSDKEIHFANLFHLFHRACEAVDYTGWESMPVRSDNVDKVAASRPRVQVHGQVVLLSEAEMWLESL